MYLEDPGGPEKDLYSKCFTAVVLKRTDCRQCSCSTAAVVWCQLIAGEAKAGLAAAVLAARFQVGRAKVRIKSWRVR